MIGNKLNQRYQIEDMLGEGATSTVYRGRDLMLGREVALKILHPHVRDTTRKRFFQEAMAAAQLNHPNIMLIYDRGEDDGRDYLVVEYVHGVPLSHYIPSPHSMLLDLGIQVADALHYAHEHDIIHRDIKPANIMVTPEKQIKIMDLGLALPREAKRVTAPGMVIGTPAYISPEQARGKDLDRRTDIYSLGIVLYEMATGQLPFNADDITALLLQHVQQPPTPPHLIDDSISPALENVILKALEKDRERRFASGRALAETLRAIGQQRPGRGVAMETSEAAGSYPDDNELDAPTRESQQSTQPRNDGMIRLVLADDQKLLRHTLAQYLQTHPDMIVLDEASDGNEAIEKVLINQPDVLLLDLNMPGRTGLDALPELRERAPDVKVLVLTGRDDDHYIMRALRAGAHGYVLKTTDESQLVESIRSVMQDEIVLGAGVGSKLQHLLIPDSSRLTDLELDVLLHVAVGMENEEISAKFDLDMTEIIEVNARIMDKMGAKDRHTAALKAIGSGLILLEDMHDLRPRSES